MKNLNPLTKAVAFAIIVSLLFLNVIAAQETEKADDPPPIDELKAKASEGDSEAMLELGERMVFAEDEATKDTEVGLKWLQKAADAGKLEAWYNLGVVYLNGIGVELDFSKGMEYIRKGAELGESNCQTSMGMIYQAGEKIPGGVKEDPEKAVKWYKMAAEQDHTEAIQHLAVMYSGRGLEPNYEEALRFYRKGAELGNADCIWGLGRCYLRGRGVDVDSVMAYGLCLVSLDGVRFPEQKKAMTERVDELGKALNDEQLKLAQKISQEWAAKVVKE